MKRSVAGNEGEGYEACRRAFQQHCLPPRESPDHLVVIHIVPIITKNPSLLSSFLSSPSVFPDILILTSLADSHVLAMLGGSILWRNSLAFFPCPLPVPRKFRWSP